MITSFINIFNSTIRNNTANGTGSNDGGGGLYGFDQSEMNISNTTIEGNFSFGKGGGIYSYPDSKLSIDSSYIHYNEAQNNGGGIYLLGTSIPNRMIINSSISNFFFF